MPRARPAGGRWSTQPAFGREVSFPGDIDGDGWLDLLVGATGLDLKGSALGGATYVMYGGGE